MKHILTVVHLICLFILTSYFYKAHGQVLTPMGDVTIGSTGGDYLIRTIRTSDGGYFLVGFVNTVNTNVSGPAQGNYDYWAVKTDASGQIVWNQLLGSAANDYVADVKEDLVNRGFVIMGYTESAHASGNISTPGKGGPSDIWVIKVSADGNLIIWETRLGGNNEDYGISINQTPNGNYLIAGFTNSSPNTGDLGNDPAKGSYDYRLIHLSATGVVLWDKRIGGPGFDGTGLSGGLMSVLQTSDGGYLVGGRSFSAPGGDKSATNNGVGSDIWIIKMDASRTIQWDIILGGADEDKLTSVIEMSDGYVVGGTTTVEDPVLGLPKNKDYWIVKLDESGVVSWQNNYGGSADDELTSIIQAADGGFWLGGWSFSGEEADKSQPGFGSADYWIIKLLSNGSKDYDATFGGSAGDYLSDILETSDNGMLLAGFSGSDRSGSKTAFNNGEDDFWLLKLNGIIPLPVDLLFFNAQIISNKFIELSWSTASEVNNAFFTVERSVDALTFYSVLEVAGAENSNELHTYSVIDNEPINGVSYYRLKQTDFDGTFKHSKIVAITDGTPQAALKVAQVSPKEAKILYRLAETEEGILSLYDSKGVQLWSRSVTGNAAFSEQIVSLPQSVSGFYVVSLQSAGGVIMKKLIIL